MEKSVRFIEEECKDWKELNVLRFVDKDNIILQDNQGYRYTTSLSVIRNSRRRNNNLNRFFRNNPHTIYNIRHYLKINNIDHILISDQIDNAKSKATWNCLIHGDFIASWNEIQSGNGCPECGKEIASSKRRNSYKYVESVFKEHNLKLVSKEYINNLEPLEFICDLHQEKEIQTTSFGNLITKECVCTYCNKEKFKLKMMKSQEEFSNDIFEIHGENISIIGEYKGSNKYIEVRCNKCNHIWKTKATHLISGHGCPTCKSPSKGEDLIREYLQNSNIKFKEQYRIKECRHKRPLPFDFAILNSNNGLLCLIEFDGRQHFKPTGFGCTSENKINKNFELQQTRDKIKDDYCKLNSIKLIRIPYWEINNINSILDPELSVFFN